MCGLGRAAGSRARADPGAGGTSKAGRARARAAASLRLYLSSVPSAPRPPPPPPPSVPPSLSPPSLLLLSRAQSFVRHDRFCARRPRDLGRVGASGEKRKPRGGSRGSVVGGWWPLPAKRAATAAKEGAARPSESDRGRICCISRLLLPPPPPLRETGETRSLHAAPRRRRRSGLPARRASAALPSPPPAAVWGPDRIGVARARARAASGTQGRVAAAPLSRARLGLSGRFIDISGPCSQPVTVGAAETKSGGSPILNNLFSPPPTPRRRAGGRIPAGRRQRSR